jgi:hypothetical protein
MVELEADDGLASAAWLAATDPRVEKVCIWTPDKDLAQCVRGDRVVQVDRKSKSIRNAEAVRQKFGVDPERIPDYLALVGDSADGYPGISGIGGVTAARLVNRYGTIEDFPATCWAIGERWRSSSSSSLRFAPMRRSSPTSMSCNGAARHPRSKRWPSAWATPESSRGLARRRRLPRPTGLGQCRRDS